MTAVLDLLGSLLPWECPSRCLYLQLPEDFIIQALVITTSSVLQILPSTAGQSKWILHAMSFYTFQGSILWNMVSFCRVHSWIAITYNSAQHNVGTWKIFMVWVTGWLSIKWIRKRKEQKQSYMHIKEYVQEKKATMSYIRPTWQTFMCHPVCSNFSLEFLQTLQRRVSARYPQFNSTEKHLLSHTVYLALCQQLALNKAYFLLWRNSQSSWGRQTGKQIISVGKPRAMGQWIEGNLNLARGGGEDSLSQ